MEDLNFHDDECQESVNYRKPARSSSGEKGSRSRRPVSRRWRDIEMLDDERRLQQLLREVYS